MAKQSITTLKGWFVTFAKPVQAQFADWLDSFRHKDDKIGTGDLDSTLLDLINSLPTAAAIGELMAAIGNKADLVGGILKQSQWPPILVPQSTTYNTDGTFSIPANTLLEKIIVTPTADINLSIGTSLGGNQLQPAMIYYGGITQVTGLDAPAAGTPRTIYFTGITSQTTIKFYTR